MIVVDSSALVAIFQRERDAALYATAIQRADRLVISAVNVHETGMVMRARRGIDAERLVWRFLREDNDFEIALLLFKGDDFAATDVKRYI